LRKREITCGGFKRPFMELCRAHMTRHKIWTKHSKVMDITDQKQILKSAPGYRMMNSHLLQPRQMIFWEYHLLLREKLW